LKEHPLRFKISEVSYSASGNYLAGENMVKSWSRRTTYLAFVLLCVACSGDKKKAADNDASGDGGLQNTKRAADGAVINGDSNAFGSDGSSNTNSASTTDGASSTDSGGSAWNPTADSSIVKIVEGGVPITLPDGGTYLCNRITCNNKMLECADCLDNDGDGLVDSMDPQCLGPCDNTEGPALEPGIGGDTGDQCKRDCYFDFGNGSGNDDCRWAYSCDPLEPKEKCVYKQSLVGKSDCPDTQSQQCLNLCLPITPNGCDCFGCCTFPELMGKGAGGKDQYVWIGRTEEPFCTFSSVSDAAACPPCTPEPSCTNTCGRCEICIGKPTIPADCLTQTTDGGVPGSDSGIPTSDGGGDQNSRCNPGVQPCGLPADALCPADQYCITGCCISVIM
jgi:hypothetical protein